MSAIRSVRADLVPAPIRGNVATRIERARERGDDALMLAMAGLRRLGLADDPALDVGAIPVTQVVPEAGQGAVVVQAPARTCERTGLDWSRLDHVATRRAVQLERALAKLFGGGCERPVGVHVELADGNVHVFVSASPDEPGQRICHAASGTELGTLVSVSAADDVDDAADWTATQLHPHLVDALAGATQEATR
jgi:hydroxymethylbilane synthase